MRSSPAAVTLPYPRIFGGLPLLFLATIPLAANALLYQNSKLIEELNATTFNSSVYSEQRDFVYLIEFYNSWCGHCQAFAPKYEAAAEALEPWRRWIHIAAVDCSEGNNFDICARHNIQATPTILFFRPLKRQNNDTAKGDVSNYLGDVCRQCDQEVEKWKQTIASYLTTNAAYLPIKLAEQLVPLKDDSALGDGTANAQNGSSSWRQQSVNAIVFEGPKSVLGADLILRLAPVVTNVSVYRSFDVDMAHKYGAMGRRPALVIDAGGDDIKRADREVFSYPLANYTTRLRKFIEAVGRYDTAAWPSPDGLHNQRLQLYVVLADEHKNNKKSSGGDTGGCDMTKMPEFLRPNANDINSAVVYSLRAEVLSNDELQGSKKFALQRYLKMLLNFAPLRPIVRGAVKRLENVLENAGNNSSAKRAQMKTALRVPELNDTLLTAMPVNWTACRASKPGLRGYPCALWITFHTITVGAYNATVQGEGVEAMGNGTAKSNPNALDIEDGALLAIQGYIENFFSCRECVNHFMRMWRKFEKSLRNNTSTSATPTSLEKQPTELTNQQAMLWLWRAHNQVNARLAGDATEDPHFPKVKFPPRSLCTECYGSDLATLDQLDETAVVDFLTSWYSFPRQDISA